ncbi:hypothetical protein BJV78DRAFT_647995 [Lactifluus subvellereus]|nr:hypothetical protein BJV78DRAFT_647995 [Lactifluus subvellereus]
MMIIFCSILQRIMMGQPWPTGRHWQCLLVYAVHHGQSETRSVEKGRAPKDSSYRIRTTCPVTSSSCDPCPIGRARDAMQ